jgi:hypothetical protein
MYNEEESTIILTEVNNEIINQINNNINNYYILSLDNGSKRRKIEIFDEKKNEEYK